MAIDTLFAKVNISIPRIRLKDLTASSGKSPNPRRYFHKRTYITFEQFYGIFSDFSSSVLILHYDKSSQLCNDAILKFSDEILAGEVTSVKKLIYI